MTGTGRADDPWVLRTPPGTSEYTMYRDDGADPPALVCQVGSTRLTYHAARVDDLHAWLREQGDWVPLGAADEQKPAKDGHRRGVGRGPSPTRSAAGTACARATAAGSGCTCRRCSRSSGLAELEHQPRNNRMRAR